MRLVDSVGPGLVVWPHSISGEEEIMDTERIKGWWVVVAVHVVAVAWFLGVMAVIGIIDTFGG